MLAKPYKPKGSVLPQRLTNHVVNTKASTKVQRTEAQLHENGLTYNEAGYTYNQAGVTYGGVYGTTDTRPLVSLAQNIHPTIVRSGGVDLSYLIILAESSEAILDEAGGFILQES